MIYLDFDYIALSFFKNGYNLDHMNLLDDKPDNTKLHEIKNNKNLQNWNQIIMVFAHLFPAEILETAVEVEV